MSPPRPNGRDESEDRPPPYNAEAEQHVIGGLMANNGAYKRIAELLGPESFGNPHHGRLFVAIGELITQGLPANPDTLCGHLARDETMRDLDPAKYLVGLRDAGRLAGVDAYARVVHELYNRRNAIPVLKDMFDAAYSADLTQPFDRITADLIKRLPHANGVAPQPENKVLDFVALQDKPVRDRRWLVPDWIPWGRVTGLYGAGGEGKTLVSQQLMTAAALQKPWLGRAVQKVRSYGLLCEDDDEEAHLRQVQINKLYGCDFADLGNMRARCRLGYDNVMMSFDSGRPLLTDFYHQFLEEIKSFGAQLVVVDTGADVFAGNQNDAVQVRQFVQICLGGIARAIDGTVVINLHPSQSGKSSGSGESGSVQWEATMRSRIYLSTPKPEGDEAPDQYIRILTRKKANYAVRDETIPLRWNSGVLINTDTSTGIIGSIQRRTCERVFLDLLDATTVEGQPVSSISKAGNYAPRLFATRPDREGFRKADFERAMQTLFAKRPAEILNQDYGRKSDMRTRIVRVGAAVCGGYA